MSGVYCLHENNSTVRDGHTRMVKMDEVAVWKDVKRKSKKKQEKLNLTIEKDFTRKFGSLAASTVKALRLNKGHKGFSIFWQEEQKY